MARENSVWIFKSATKCACIKGRKFLCVAPWKSETFATRFYDDLSILFIEKAQGMASWMHTQAAMKTIKIYKIDT